jgi:predicted dehydrogenase
MNQDRKEAAEKLGLKWYRNADEMFSDKSIDAVFIATNNSSHYAIAKQALLAGKHCIVEKPMSTTLSDAESLVALAKQKKLSLAVDHMMTKNDYNVKARSIVDAKELGAVNDICLHMEFFYGATPEEAATWRCSNPAELGGPIGDVASHCFYMAEYLLNGKITAIFASYQPKKICINVENGAYVNFVMDNGVEGSARVSFAEKRGGLVGTLSNLGYEIYGDKGVLRAFGTMFQLSGHPGEPVKQHLEIESSTGSSEVPVKAGRNIYASIIQEHALSVLEGKPMDGADGLWNLKLVLATHESAAGNGKEVRVI